MTTMRNKVQLIGNLGANPEIHDTESGRKLARMSVATNETYRNAQGDKITATQWHKVVVWGRQAELVEKYLSKGSEVAIEGKLNSYSYDDKEGNKRFVTEIVMDYFLMLGKKQA